MSVPNLKSVYDSIDFSEEVPPPSPSSQSSNSDSEMATEISTNHQQQMATTNSIVEDILNSGNALSGGKGGTGLSGGCGPPRKTCRRTGEGGPCGGWHDG